MTIAASVLFGAMTTAQAVATLLNSPSSCGAKTYAAAREIVEKGAASGKTLQQFVIGVTTEDKELAKKYLEASRWRIRQMAEDRDNPLAWYLLAKEKDDLQMLKRAAEGGNVQALNALGSISTAMAFQSKKMSKEAVEEVLATSFSYFSRAAAQQDANGMVNMGACYLRGLGCKQDMQLAFECFRAAAKAGHPEGMDNMSACYQFGHGVEKNAELSLYWAMRGRAARGNAAAEKWLRERK